MVLKRLYKKTKTGAIQICDIGTSGATIIVTFGQLDGKLQQKYTECSPKNVGKKNETSAQEQAESEAQSKWDKKIKAGYTEDQSGEVIVRLPQKVKAYVGNEHKINFPAYSTPKYNGINGTYWLQEDGSLKLTSRGGDEYPAIPHLESMVTEYMHVFGTKCLNGELYIHGEHLQDITSAVKKPREMSKRLQFMIFEAPGAVHTVPDTNVIEISPKSLRAFTCNFYAVSDPMGYATTCPYTYGRLVDKFVRCVEHRLVKSYEELEAHYEECMANGLEGTVIYNSDAEYKFNERSSSVYKYKKTLDAEYPIVDCEVDKNGHPVFHCITSSGAVFKVKPKGTDAERKQMVRDFESVFLNKWYKIEYETLSKDGKPLKPVGLCLRDCDENGEPLL